MELADVFDQMVFPCEAITSFTSAIVHGTISILRLVYARFVPLQVGRASETTSTYTYELLWPGMIHGELEILNFGDNKFGIGNGILFLISILKKRRNSL